MRYVFLLSILNFRLSGLFLGCSLRGRNDVPRSGSFIGFSLAFRFAGGLEDRGPGSDCQSFCVLSQKLSRQVQSLCFDHKRLIPPSQRLIVDRQRLSSSAVYFSFQDHCWKPLIVSCPPKQKSPASAEAKAGVFGRRAL
jgi:hypothetical protein